MRHFFWYLAPHTVFLAAIALFDMFVAFYFFRFGTGSFVGPLAFAAAGWIVVPFGQGAAASLSRSVSLPTCLRVGALATAVTFAAVALLAAIGTPWWALIPIGVAYGAARSLYWLARHQVDYLVSKSGNSDSYFGWQTALTTGVSTTLGIACGIVVESFPGAGYVVVFGLGAALLVLTAFTVRNHPIVYGSFSTDKLRQLTSLNPSFRRVFLASILRGASGLGALPLAIQVFTFAALRRELPVAGLSGLGAVLALVLGSLVASAVQPRHRTGIAWSASLILLGLGAALALMPTGLLGSVYLVLGPIATVLLVMPTLAIDNAIFSYDESVVAEYTVAREIGLALGRLASTVPLIFIVTNPTEVGPYLVLLSLAYPAQVLLLIGLKPAQAISS